MTDVHVYFEPFSNANLRERLWSHVHYEEMQILFLCHGQCFFKQVPVPTNYMARPEDGQ
jgi:hypothetical protein